MPNFEELLNELVMSGKNYEILTNSYQELRSLVKKNSEREIRFVEECSDTLEERFEAIMFIQKDCKEQLAFLDIAMLLFENCKPEIVQGEKEVAMAS